MLEYVQSCMYHTQALVLGSVDLSLRAALSKQCCLNFIYILVSESFLSCEYYLVMLLTSCFHIVWEYTFVCSIMGFSMSVCLLSSVTLIATRMHFTVTQDDPLCLALVFFSPLRKHTFFFSAYRITMMCFYIC